MRHGHVRSARKNIGMICEGSLLAPRCVSMVEEAAVAVDLDFEAFCVGQNPRVIRTLLAPLTHPAAGGSL